MNIYELKEQLERRKQKVFSIRDIAALKGFSSAAASVYLNRMLKKNLVYRVGGGKFSISADPFVISSNLFYPSYISFYSAFYIYGMVEQVIDSLFIVTPKFRKNRVINNTRVIFVKFPERAMFGFKKMEYADGYINIAEKEKAFIDSLILPRYTGMDYLNRIVKEMDVQILKKYAFMTGSEAVMRRIGFLFDINGIENDIKIRSKTAYKLNPSIKEKGKFNSKWRMYINEAL